MISFYFNSFKRYKLRENNQLAKEKDLISSQLTELHSKYQQLETTLKTMKVSTF